MAKAGKKEKRKEVDVVVRPPKPHPMQVQIIGNPAKRKIIRAGRRSGKTVVAAIISVIYFVKGLRVLYATPTSEQFDRYWFEVKKALEDGIVKGAYTKNETKHEIIVEGSLNRIKAKTAWNADTLRGDFGDLLILDEYQLMNEDTWGEVGLPMMLDTNGDAIFIYTPPSLHSSGISRARDPRHAAKMYKKAINDATGLMKAFHFTSLDNPYLSKEALDSIAKEMSQTSYRQEILAEDMDETFIGLVYKKFNEPVCSINRFYVPDKWLVYTGHDFGGANPAALFYAQNPETGEFFLFHEYRPIGGGFSPAGHIMEWKKIVGDRTVVKSVGGSHQEQEIRDAYSSNGWFIEEPYASRKLAQIDHVIRFHELNKIKTFNDNFNYLNEKSSFSWRVDDTGMPTDELEDEARYHLMACERYLFTNLTGEGIMLAGDASNDVRVTSYF